MRCASIFAQFEVTIPGANGQPAFTFIANTPDPDIKQLPQTIRSVRQRDPIAFIQLLAEYINEKASCDYDRVKKIHDWVALNIKYDTQSYFSGRYPSQRFESVIKRGNAVCAGYADVFKYICDIMEIECEIVTGYARGYGSSLFKFEDVTDSNHAWNIVTIEEKKHLIDSTWNAGYVDGRTYKARYRTDYFLCDPAIFIYEHFPLSSANQLLDTPLSAEAFNALPFLRPPFFQVFETWPDLPRISEVETGEKLHLEFTAKPGYQLSHGWYTQSGTRVGRDVFQEKRDIYTINLPNLKPGKYFLRLWFRESGENSYSSCGQFGFHVR